MNSVSDLVTAGGVVSSTYNQASVIVLIIISLIALVGIGVVIGYLLERFVWRCKFYTRCNGYSWVNVTCNKDGGDAYGLGRPGGCYRDLEAKGKESKFWKA